MAAYGGYNGYPRQYGGGKTAHQIVHESLLDALAPGYSPADDSASNVELYAYALAAAMIWSANDRLRNQSIPARMLEALPDWETILKLRASSADYVQQRRARVAAKLRGLVNNAFPDISDAVEALAAVNFDELVTADDADLWAWWPGVDPGPPGYEWTGDRPLIGVVLTRDGLTDADFFALLERTIETLEAMCPTWLGFAVGVDEGGFTCDIGTCDVTFI